GADADLVGWGVGAAHALGPDVVLLDGDPFAVDVDGAGGPHRHVHGGAVVLAHCPAAAMISRATASVARDSDFSVSAWCAQVTQSAGMLLPGCGVGVGAGCVMGTNVVASPCWLSSLAKVASENMNLPSTPKDVPQELTA